MACLKKLAFVLCSILLLVAAVLFFTIGTESQAEAAEINEAAYEILVDGETVSEVAVKRGETITVTVGYEGNTYIPAVILGSDEYHIAIDGNRFSLLSDSVVGGELYLYLTIDKDNQLVGIPTPLTVYPIFENDFNLTQTMTPDGYEINGEFSSANVVVDMAGEAVDTTLSDDDDISGILASSGKDSYGNVTVTVRSLTLSGRNNLGNEMPFTVENGVANLSIDAYATNSALSGSGTSSSPYMISDASDFDLIKNYDSSSSTVYFKQDADITINGNSTLNLKTFYGYYSGENHTLIRSGEMTNGAFCHANRGTITELKIVYVNGSMVAGFLFAGGVCSINYGTLSHIYVYDGVENSLLINNYVTISALSFGGIVGCNMSSAYIINCSVGKLGFTRINTQIADGGIVGNNNGWIVNCNVGMVKFSYSKLSQQCIGGLAGSNNESGIIGHLFYQNNLSCVIIIDFSAVTSVESADDGILKIGQLVGHNDKGSVDATKYVKASRVTTIIPPSAQNLLIWTYIKYNDIVGETT